MYLDSQMLLTVSLFKPRTWTHALDKIFHKLQQSGLVLVGMRIVTLDKTVATSLLPAARVTENVQLKNLFSLMATISSIVHTVSLACRSL